MVTQLREYLSGHQLRGAAWLAVKIILVWLLANSGDVPFVYQGF